MGTRRYHFTTLLAITNLPSNEHKLDLSNKQTNKYNTIINRVIRKVRRLGGENGQFLHNRGMNRVTGNENFTK